MRFPVVAAIHGACLGGGIGVGAGLRLPRGERRSPAPCSASRGAAGRPARRRRHAAAAAAGGSAGRAGPDPHGRRVKASKALKLGLVDEVVPAPLLSASPPARRGARRAASGPSARGWGCGRCAGRTRAACCTACWARGPGPRPPLEENLLRRAVLFRKAREQVVAKSGGHYPAPEKALRGGAHRASRRASMAAWPARRTSSASWWSATSRTGSSGCSRRRPAQEGSAASPARTSRRAQVRKVGVLGAGLMGAGIAYVGQRRAEARLKDCDYTPGRRRSGTARRTPSSGSCRRPGSRR